MINPRDIGAYLATAFGLDLVNVTAGGAGDATAANGVAFDRLSGVGASRHPNLSCVAVVPVKAVLQAGETASVPVNLQHADDDGAGSPAAFSDYTYRGDGEGSLDPTTLVLTGGAGGTTERGVVFHKVDLSGAKQWIRLVATPDLSAADTDTAEVGSGLLVFGGMDLPAAV